MPTPRVVDLSHHQAHVNFKALKDHGVEAVILKATQGSSFIDSEFHDRMEQASAAGLLTGAYHFLDGSDAEKQWRNFIGTVSGFRPLLLCLDFEGNPNGSTATLDVLTAMVKASVRDLSRHPVLYGSNLLKDALANAKCDKEVKACKRWGARYGKLKPSFECDLWQYTDKAMIGSQGPYDASDLISKIYPTVAAFWQRWRI